MKSPFTHFIHAQHTHCSCNLIQLHIPSSWIKLFRPVHQQAHGNLLFFLPSFSGFLTFLTLLCLHVYLQSYCVLSLLSSPFSQCLSVSKLSQCLWLSSESFPRSPKPSLLPVSPKLNPSPHSEPLFQLSLTDQLSLSDSLDHHTPLRTPVLDFPNVLLQPPTGFQKTQPKPHRTCQKSIQTLRARK